MFKERRYAKTVIALLSVIIVLLALFIFLRLFGIGGRPDAPKPLPEGIKVRLAEVTSVKDIRTLEVRILEDNSKITLRLIGIEEDLMNLHTSEISNRLSGKQCYLRYDKEVVDDFDRHLVYLYDENKIMVNTWILKEGFSTLEIKPPNVELYRELEAAQEEAWKNGRGLWRKIPYKRR